MKIKDCTSLMCNNYNCDYCNKCSHAIFYGEGIIGKRKWRWEFNPYHGARFLTTKGKEFKKGPKENHAIWIIFEKWLEEELGK